MEATRNFLRKSYYKFIDLYKIYKQKPICFKDTRLLNLEISSHLPSVYF